MGHVPRHPVIANCRKTRTLVVRLVKRRLAWCIADEGFVSFTAEDLVPFADTRISFACKNCDNISADLHRVTLSPTNTADLSGATQRLVADLILAVTLYAASFGDINGFGISITAGCIFITFTLLAVIFLSCPPRPQTPCPPLPRPPRRRTPRAPTCTTSSISRGIIVPTKRLRVFTTSKKGEAVSLRPPPLRH